MTTRRRVLLAGAVLLTALLLVGGWLAYRVWQAADAARDLQAATSGADEEVSRLDVAALRSRLAAVQDAAARVHAAGQDPVWRVAEHLPVVGDDLAAVSAIGRAADALAGDAAPDLLDALEALAGPSGSAGASAGAAQVPDGWVDLQALADAAPALDRAAVTVQQLRADLAAVDPAGLAGPLAGPVAGVRDAVDAAAGPLQTVRELAPVLPDLLGEDGPRTYLLLSLNPAELRAQGGIVGAVSVLQARDGAVGLVGQRSTADLPELAEPALPLSDDELALFGDRLGRWVQDTVLTPDFPRAAEAASAFWTASTGQQVDGVLATDPVVVADLLGATGRTVSADGTELGGEDLLRGLLRDAYLAYGDPKAGDAFYAQVAAAAFAVLRDAAADPQTAGAAVQVAADAVEQRRVALWSADAGEQARIASSALGGAFLTGDPSTPTGTVGQAVGVFLDDATAGKLDVDLDARVAVTLTGCGSSDVRARIELTLGYRPPADVTTFPAQVLGDGGSGLPPGWLATNVSFYSARDGRLGEVRRDDAVVGGQEVRTARRDVAVVTSRLEPGATETYTLTVPAPASGITVWTTPTLTGPGTVSSPCPTPR
ncbi:DUF4012 domain-containing protein [Cellulomonas sp. C5510]|uniref:DUF4012 domain-containing protein n=1 Tax=Cellulomonas sp. C5510 TaxID=2871170 RepID=UPI001C980F8F|nr:DUF4012 domain-containing protein [Cellulomonas sp. C5510]QZN86174.1 DUF4012 domain-containing protein [Cellulomonas sp. C5510]